MSLELTKVTCSRSCHKTLCMSNTSKHPHHSSHTVARERTKMIEMSKCLSSTKLEVEHLEWASRSLRRMNKTVSEAERVAMHVGHASTVNKARPKAFSAHQGPGRQNNEASTRTVLFQAHT